MSRFDEFDDLFGCFENAYMAAETTRSPRYFSDIRTVCWSLHYYYFSNVSGVEPDRFKMRAFYF